jgi:hypothetical protein
MPRRPRRQSTANTRARLLLPVLCTLVALAVAARALNTAWVNRGPLDVVLGDTFAAWRVLLGLTGILCVAAVVHRLTAGTRGEWPERPWAGVRLMAYVLALGVVVYTVWLQPIRGPVAEMHLGVCAGAYLLAMLVAERLPRLGARYRPALDLALLGLLGLVLSAELALTLWNSWKPGPLLARPGGTAAEHVTRESLEPGSLIRDFPVNTLGDYDTEFAADGRRLVVTVGDSFSLGIVPYPYHFTTVAEERLATELSEEVEVYNVGLPTLGPKEYLYLLETRVVDLDPELIVVNIFVGNDINQAKNRELWDGGGWSRLGADNWLLALLITRLGVLSGQPLADDAAPEEGHGDTGWPRGDPRIEQLKTSSLERWPWLADPDLERTMMTETVFLNVETTRARRVCSRWTAGYMMLFEILEDMRVACAPVPMLVMIIPDEFQVEEPLWQSIVERTPGEELDRFQPQRLLVAGLAERGIPALDLLPVLRAMPREMGVDGLSRRRVYHLRDTHINTRGNRLVGEALADFLAEHLH